MWAIIGGSGFEKNPDYRVINSHHLDTPFGVCSASIQHIRVANIDALFLSRHGIYHELLPSEINYRANIYALKALGATKILALSTVGSLQSELKPGEIVVPTQFIDQTKGIRKTSFLGEGVTGHVSLANPTSIELVSALQNLLEQLDFGIHFNRTYLCIEGPYYSTRAESLYYRRIGADIIGMTSFPEYALAREAGIGYLPCCIVTDYDCWNESLPEVNLAKVMDTSLKNKEKIQQIIKRLLPKTLDLLAKGCPELGLKHALLTPIEYLSAQQKSWLSIILA